MSDDNKPADVSATKRALIEIRDLRARLAQVEEAARESIAIVGAGIRAPGGVRDMDSFAQLLWSGTDAITPIPEGRWDVAGWYDESADAPGKSTVRFGGFVEEVDRFDAEFFGISPREAASMDPQQRLMLELSWEALEDAGRSPAALAGTRSGVYLGIANNDYGRSLFAHPELIDAYFSPGNAYSVASGRLSYLLGLHGPAISIDTACSSSLVAVHLACQALRLGDCDLALAGGVNLMLSPEINVNFSKAGMMAPDGRCKTFDAAANGYVRGEGGGMVVLRRLKDALASGDRILAVIRGSAVNQDGRSNGLTAPNGPAQEAVLRAAFAAAGVRASQVGYVEAHGTGTSLGDPIEVNALGAVLREGRDGSHPAMVGSVKTNMGHLEAAAGIVGLLKAVLALERREIPPHLHFSKPNPFIDWDSMPLAVPTRAMPFEPTDGRRIAGVSSFGFSGTNAHVVLEEAPAAAARAAPVDRPQHVLALSARDARALPELAGAYAKRLRDGDRLADLAHTANAGRSHFAHRLSVRAATGADAAAALESAAKGADARGLVRGFSETAPRIAFLFTGGGAQTVGMARKLYDRSPVFRAALDECAAILDPLLGRGLLELIDAPGDLEAPIHQTRYGQPAQVAVEIALAALWRSWGIVPSAVLGHSLGEYAAAHVAGIHSLEDALRIVVERTRAVDALNQPGAMATLFAPADDVQAHLASTGSGASIAAYNGPENVVVSGSPDAVDAVAAHYEKRNVRVSRLRVAYASHSAAMDPALEPFERAIAGVRFEAPRVAFVSNTTGAAAGLELVGRPAYWRDHLRRPVRFAQSIQALPALGITHYLEVGPHPVLVGMGASCIAAGEGAWLPSLRRNEDDWDVILDTLQQLYAAGAEVDWRGFDAPYARQVVAAPTYPFQRRRHWIDLPGTARAPDTAARWLRLTDAMDRQADRGPLDLNASSYPAKFECLARITVAHAVRTLREAGLFTRAGERHGVEDLMAAAGITPTYRHLVQRWLQSLAGSGLLRREGDQFTSTAPLPDPGLDALWQEADRLFADNQPLLAYVRHCGTLVGEVLRGRESPLETLFPGGSFELAQGLYERSSTMLYINQLAAAAFEVLGSTAGAGQRLRVMEVGAGTGGTSSSLLTVLDPARTDYVLTDVSDAFLDRLRDRFSGRAGLRYALFDLDKDPGPQGHAPASLDAIVAANAVHAVKDLKAALARLHSLLAPGGVLVLVESTEHLAYFDMTTGLIEGWQHFADDLRGDNPLIAPERWIAALAQAGFEEARAWPPSGSPAVALGQHVIVARVKGEVQPAVCQAGASAEAEAPGPAADAAEAEQAGRIAKIAAAGAAERRDLLTELVRAQVMQVLRADPANPPSAHDRLMSLGMDSLMAVQLRNALNRALKLQRSLPSTLMFDYPTIDAIAAHLAQRFEDVPQPAGAPVAAPAAAPAVDAAAVAGMSDEEIARLLDERVGTR